MTHRVGPSEDEAHFNTHSLYAPLFTDEFLVDLEPDIGAPLLLHLVPEPTTINLLALGTLALMRTR